MTPLRALSAPQDKTNRSASSRAVAAVHEMGWILDVSGRHDCFCSTYCLRVAVSVRLSMCGI